MSVSMSMLMMLMLVFSPFVGLWTQALQPLLAWAEAVIPRSQWHTTPVFLFGTAGLRVLSPESQAKLLGNVQSSLKKSAFRYGSSKLTFLF